MQFKPEKYHRRSIRLTEYDYAQAGAYFVTIVTQNRSLQFGDVTDGDLQANDAGRMVRAIWDDIPTFYLGVQIDEFAVMPNHIHGIVVLASVVPASVVLASVVPASVVPASVVLASVVPASVVLASVVPASVVPASVGADPRVCPRTSPDTSRIELERGQTRGSAPTEAKGMSLAEVIQRFKSLTTNRYAEGVKQSEWPPFPGRLWQRNYYEHVVRDKPELERIRQYIADNPSRWADDEENPLKALG